MPAFEEFPLSVVGEGAKVTTKWCGLTPRLTVLLPFQSWRLGSVSSPSSFLKESSSQLPEGLEIQLLSQCVPL